MIYDFSDINLFNPIYVPLLYDEHRYKVLYGGRDSGKSDFVAQAIIIDLLKNEFFRGILVRKFYANIKATQFQTIVDYIRLWDLADNFHITTNPLSIVCKLNGNQVLAKGLDQPDNTKSIKDPTTIWYEEADQISESAFIETSLTLRSSRTRKLTEWLTFNPRQEQSWLNTFFFPPKHTYEREDGNFHWVKSIRPDTIILHTTYKDNHFCTSDRAALLESLKHQDMNLYKVNTLGLWGGALKGLIYPDWTATDEFPFERGDEVFGLDYGFNNPSALVHLSYFEEKLYIRELLYVTHHTHSQLVSLINTEFRQLIRNKPIVVDSEEPALITELRRAGYNAIPSIKGPNSVYSGILLAKRFDWHITKDSTNIIKEIQSYIWKENKDGKLLDEPVKIDDHAMDAIRYAVQTYGAKHWLKKSNLEIIRPRIKEDKFRGF